MRFSRAPFAADLAPDTVQLCRRMRPGVWLVEAGSHPPPAHRPGVLLAGRAAQGGMAASLRGPTVLHLDLGPALVERIADEGCVLSPLAAMALHEVLLNAVVHGNLDVSSGPAIVWSDLAARERLVAAALDDPARAGRVVTVALGWDAECVSAVIADQGAGYRQAEGRPAPGSERRGAGRGLMIARAAARVEVLRGGRCTRLVFGRAQA